MELHAHFCECKCAFSCPPYIFYISIFTQRYNEKNCLQTHLTNLNIFFCLSIYRTAKIEAFQKEGEKERIAARNNSLQNNNNNNINTNNNQTLNSISPLKDNTNIQQLRTNENDSGSVQSITNNSIGSSSSNSNVINTNTSVNSAIKNSISAVASLATNATRIATTNNALARTNNKKSTRVPPTKSTPKTLVATTTTTTSANGSTEGSLKYLESLAQQAGINANSTSPILNTYIKMEKTQNAGQQATGPAPLQFSAEQLQHLQQQYQLQQAFAGNTIQVKQEFPNQQPTGMHGDRQQLGDPNQVHQVQQMQLIDASGANSQQHPPHSSAMGMSQNPQGTTMTTMSPLLQGSADWRQGQVQVVQQPLQNQLLSPFYGSSVLAMPSNLMHPSLGQQQIQVIAAGKPFQSGQITPQMLTTAQGKPMMSNGTSGFSSTFLPTSQGAQAVLFSPVNVLSSSQPQQQQQQQNQLISMTNGNVTPTGQHKNQQDMQKNFQSPKVQMQKVNNATPGTQNVTNVANQQQANQLGVQVSQAMPTAQIINQLPQSGAQQMQSAPWLQSAATVPQFWTTPQQVMIAPQNSFFIRSQPDGTQLFLQQPAQPQAIQAQPQQQTIVNMNQPQQQQQQQQQPQPQQPQQAQVDDK